MYTIKENVENEIIINKSRFITKIFKIKNKIEIDDILINIKREFKDATHYCYAYILDNTKKASDDGEPSHTAGLPILNVLENKELNNVLVVVIRYFGGTKLGAGGLVRAYSNATSSTIDKTEIITLKKEHKIKITFNYEDIEMVNYYLKDYKITYKEYGANVIYEFIYEEDNYPDDIDVLLIKKEEIL